MRTNVARWMIEHDPDATRACYARIAAGSECLCSICQNYFAVGEHEFPSEVIELLKRLGVPLAKPAEITGICQTATGRARCGIWYHLVGRIVAGDDCWHPSRPFCGERLANDAVAGFSHHRWLVDDAFRDHATVQMDLFLDLPSTLETDGG